jgi:hypothetical protein
MAPYHVARSKLFVRERAAKALVHLDTAQIEANIVHTHFPVPEDEQHESTRGMSCKFGLASKQFIHSEVRFRASAPKTLRRIA